MEPNTARELWGKYYAEIMKLGKMPLNKSVTIKDLKLNKTTLSNCYRDMKTFNFERSAIDFICYISTHNFMDEWKNDFEDKYNFESTKYADMVEKSDVFYVQKICLLKLFSLHFKRNELSINTIRLFNVDSYYAYDTDAYRTYNGTFDETIFRLAEKKGVLGVETFPSYFFFKTINGLRYLEDTLMRLMDKIPTGEQKQRIIEINVTNIVSDIMITLRLNPLQFDKIKDIR